MQRFLVPIYIYIYIYSIYHIIIKRFKEPKSGTPPTIHHPLNKTKIFGVESEILTSLRLEMNRLEPRGGKYGDLEKKSLLNIGILNKKKGLLNMRILNQNSQNLKLKIDF